MHTIKRFDPIKTSFIVGFGILNASAAALSIYLFIQSATVPGIDWEQIAKDAMESSRCYNLDQDYDWLEI